MNLCFSPLVTEWTIRRLRCLHQGGARSLAAALSLDVERGQDTERFHSFASRMLLLALALLAPGFAGDLCVVLERGGFHRRPGPAPSGRSWASTRPGSAQWSCSAADDLARIGLSESPLGAREGVAGPALVAIQAGSCCVQQCSVPSPQTK